MFRSSLQSYFILESYFLIPLAEGLSQKQFLKSKTQNFLIAWEKTLPRACNFIKKETPAQVFSCEFCGISRNTFFTELI